MSTEKPEQDVKPEGADGLAVRLAAARKRTEKATNGKPGASKEAVAGGVTTMSGLLRRRLEIGDMLDQVAEELGIQYGELVQVQTAIGKELYKQLDNSERIPSGNPYVSESFTAEAVRNRISMELAAHSSGGGNQSILGPVRYRESLVATFKKIAGGEL